MIVALVGNDAESLGALQSGGAGFATLSHKASVRKYIQIH